MTLSIKSNFNSTSCFVYRAQIEREREREKAWKMDRRTERERERVIYLAELTSVHWLCVSIKKCKQWHTLLLVGGDVCVREREEDDDDDDEKKSKMKQQ